jgi:protocatechuate 3,4-dioxygenase beta subunit
MKHVSILLVLLLTSICSAQAPKVAEMSAPSKITIAPKGEPGERLVVTGTVYGPDNKPLKGVSLYVYHTDIRGHYSSGEGSDSNNPRLRGYIRTSGEGRYEYDTIKPGPYPSARVPAHIHYVVTASGYKERIFEIIFEGDPFIDDRTRKDSENPESVFSLKKLERDSSGILRCVQDIRLKRE